MKVKYNEGRTLLSLWRVVIVVAICVFFGGSGLLTATAQNFFDAGSSLAGSLANNGSAADDRTVVLYYYEENAAGSGGYYIYEQLQLIGEAGAVGLADSAGNQLLPPRYEEVAPLPHAYLVKEDGLWCFLDKESLQVLADERWDTAQIDLNEKKEIASGLITVSRGGLYGAVDLRGKLIIAPAYDSFQTNSEALWPIIKVEQNGKYGFIDYDGNIVVSISYDYALLDSITVYDDENDATGHEQAIIYVYRDGRWGALYREGNGSSAVDWSVEPTEEVLAAYQDGAGSPV